MVDDSYLALEWAAECELRGVFVRREAEEQFESSVVRVFEAVEDTLS